MSARMENVREALDWLDSRAGNLLLQERKSLLVAALAEVEEWEARADRLAALLQVALEEWGEGRLAYATQSWINETRAALADVPSRGGGSSPDPTTRDNSVSAGAQATSGEPPR